MTRTERTHTDGSRFVASDRTHEEYERWTQERANRVTMTHKDYEAIATVFAMTRPADAREYPQSSNEPVRFMRNQWLSDRDAMGRMLASTNPRFDFARFVRATEA
jgi:hypothetical protein